MKQSNPPIRASHVNSGTSIPRDELAWPETEGRVVRFPKTHVEVHHDAQVTAVGGLDLVAAFCRRFRVADTLDESVRVLKRHLPYTESDHILAQAFNLYVGGSCIEDQAQLQHSEPVLKMLGAARLPDPTTAGDFLRRFDEEKNAGSLEGLRKGIDKIQSQVWGQLAKNSGGRRKKRPQVAVDIDTHGEEVYGNQKEGVDFSSGGKWSYRPLVFTIAGTSECVAIRLRPGNTKDPVDVADVIREITPRLKEHFVNVLYRGDSAFDDASVRKACEDMGAYYAFVGRTFRGRPDLAASIPDGEWREFQTRAHRTRAQRAKKKTYKPRKRKPNLRKQRARERGYKDLTLESQALAERPLTYGGKPVENGRLVIRKQIIEVHKGQMLLLPKTRHRYISTNLPKSTWSPEKVVDETYIRCDQENVIEQMNSGVALWRLPTGEEHSNAAWLEIGRLAWNLGKWIAQVALPEEVVRWEWKRFRQAFVTVPARIIETGRQIIVRFFDSIRLTQTLVAAHTKLQV